MQNEYYYKLKLGKLIDKYLDDITSEDNELGWIPDEMSKNMAEAAWLILKQNVETNEFIEIQK